MTASAAYSRGEEDALFLIHYHRFIRGDSAIAPVLKCDRDDEERELDFEIEFQRSLSVEERFRMMFQRSREIAEMLIRHGHRKPVEIIKRS